MVFYALTVMKDSQNFKRGIDVLHNLRPKLYSQPDIFEYPVVSIDTLGKLTFLFLLSVDDNKANRCSNT